MKMYPDLTVEGTPEEVAAFKHIDAALASRQRRPALKAIEGPKAPTGARKPRVKRAKRRGGGVRAKRMANPDAKAMRQWCRDTGRPIGRSGLIPEDVQAAYYAEHPRTNGYADPAKHRELKPEVYERIKGHRQPHPVGTGQ